MPSYDVVFKPRSDLYSKGNDATLLLRDLSRLGEMSIYCNMDSAAGPSTRSIRKPPTSHWNVTIKTDKGEDAIRTVFEFAEWDCDLESQRRS
jgi:two-component system chemotaxis sensor kinase CheA